MSVLSITMTRTTAASEQGKTIFLVSTGNAESKADEETCSPESPFEIYGSGEVDVEQRTGAWIHSHANI